MSRKTKLRRQAEKRLQQGQLESARADLEKLLQLDPSQAEGWRLLGRVHARAGRVGDAERCLRQSLSQAAADAGTWLELAELYAGVNRHQDLLGALKRALAVAPESAGVHYRAGRLLRCAGRYDDAERAYARAQALDGSEPRYHAARGDMLVLQGRAEEALGAFGTARELSAGPSRYDWAWARILPVIYDDVEEIDRWRAGFAQRLEALETGLRLDTPARVREAVHGVRSGTNFFLQYQGRDDLPLQCRYGALVERVMRAAFPRWAESPPMPRPGSGGRLRIGYASAFLREHNGAVWLLGWLRHRDRDRFEVYCYHTGSQTDQSTDAFRGLCDHFRHIPGNLEGACAAIAGDRLHVLVYPELGMDGPSMAMAGLRLAPVQCVGWGHPITSGLDTMDYWLSSDLMEPPDGQAHYGESLVRLPNLGNCYSTAQRDRVLTTPCGKTRADLGLPADRVIYLCTQSLFKYLPEYDELLPRIAARTPRALFVFVAISSVNVVRRFMARIDRVFAAAGLRAQDHCLMLNRLSPDDYVILNRLADVFLDNPPWSGNNTTLTAVDCALPVVTLPTEFMRGRHSAGIMRMLGLAEAIADSPESYVEAAVRLGNDPAAREGAREALRAARDRLYEDTECVRALETFYERAVQETA